MSMTTWLAEGERGLSSEAIALTALGKQPTGFGSSWPRDPDDLRRCLLLLKRVPKTLENGLYVLAGRCPKWAALLHIWDLLSETLRSEIGETLPLRGSAPKTYALMLEALDSANTGTE